jgi:HAD superfamily phosphoserine phosphatase-like hydrolase
MMKSLHKIKLVITDLDGSLVDFDNEPFHSSWDAIGNLLSKEKKEKWFKSRDLYIRRIDEAKKMTDKKKIENEWFQSDISMLKGEKEQDLIEKLFPLRYTPGAKPFFSEMDNQGKKIGILSAGLDFIIARVVKELSMDFYLCSEIEAENGFFTGKGENVVNLFNKQDYLLKICHQHNIALDETCYFGDNFNCVSCLNLVGLPIAINPKTDAVRKASRGNIIFDYTKAIELIRKYEINETKSRDKK